MESTETVVIFVVTDGKLVSWGRDTEAVAKRFIASPAWPARREDSFVAVDDWGYGKVIDATDKALIGKARRELA